MLNIAGPTAVSSQALHPPPGVISRCPEPGLSHYIFQALPHPVSLKPRPSCSQALSSSSQCSAALPSYSRRLDWVTDASQAPLQSRIRRMAISPATAGNRTPARPHALQTACAEPQPQRSQPQVLPQLLPLSPLGKPSRTRLTTPTAQPDR